VEGRIAGKATLARGYKIRTLESRLLASPIKAVKRMRVESGGSQALHVGAEPRGEGEFVEGSGGEAEDGLGGGFFGGGEMTAVYF
jgi:hypothetical protein